MISLVESLAPEDGESEDDEDDDDEDGGEEDDEEPFPSPFVGVAGVAEVAALLCVAVAPPPPIEVEVANPLLPTEAEAAEVCVPVGAASATGPTAIVDVDVG